MTGDKNGLALGSEQERRPDMLLMWGRRGEATVTRLEVARLGEVSMLMRQIDFNHLTFLLKQNI